MNLIRHLSPADTFQSIPKNSIEAPRSAQQYMTSLFFKTWMTVLFDDYFNRNNE